MAGVKFTKKEIDDILYILEEINADKNLGVLPDDYLYIDGDVKYKDLFNIINKIRRSKAMEHGQIRYMDAQLQTRYTSNDNYVNPPYSKQFLEAIHKLKENKDE